jgi:hypothetical protein
MELCRRRPYRWRLYKCLSTTKARAKASSLPVAALLLDSGDALQALLLLQDQQEVLHRDDHDLGLLLRRENIHVRLRHHAHLLWSLLQCLGS